MYKAKIIISFFLIIISFIHIQHLNNFTISKKSDITIINETNNIQETIALNAIDSFYVNEISEKVIKVLSPVKEENIQGEYEIKQYGTIMVRYKEIGTNINLIFTLKEKGIVGKAYRTNPIKFENYELVQIPENSTGFYKKGHIEIIYYYRKKEGGNINVRK